MMLFNKCFTKFVPCLSNVRIQRLAKKRSFIDGVPLKQFVGRLPLLASSLIVKYVRLLTLSTFM